MAQRSESENKTSTQDN